MLFLPRPRVTELPLEKTPKESVEWQKSMVKVPVPPPTGKPARLFRLNAITSSGPWNCWPNAVGLRKGRQAKQRSMNDQQQWAIDPSNKLLTSVCVYACMHVSSLSTLECPSNCRRSWTTRDLEGRRRISFNISSCYLVMICIIWDSMFLIET